MTPVLLAAMKSLDPRLNRSTTAAPLAGGPLVVASMLCSQLGLAASVGLVGHLGSMGVGWLRLAGAGTVLAAYSRPKVSLLARADLAAGVALGVVTAGLTLFYMAALARLPMATAASLEFLGPLSLAVVASRGGNRLWPALAAIGVTLITRPWHGGANPTGVAFALAAAACWAAYILLTRRVGDRMAGIEGLALSIPVAAVAATAATAVVAPATIGRLTWPLVGLGLAASILLPLVPFALEMMALRQLSTASFGTLMSLEPALGLVIGLVFLRQVPALTAAIGVGFVVAAGVGAERHGSTG